MLSSVRTSGLCCMQPRAPQSSKERSFPRCRSDPAFPCPASRRAARGGPQVRMAALPEAQLVAPRRALCQLRERLNGRAGDLLAAYLRDAAAAAPAPE